MRALDEAELGEFWIGFFRERFQGEINDQLLEAFQASGLSKADLARKLKRRPEQITRWLAAPNNLEADTLADLALALGMVPRIRFERVSVSPSDAPVQPVVKSGPTRSRTAKPAKSNPAPAS
jgi:transcriptional regulator with XRE-family HTH domain